MWKLFAIFNRRVMCGGYTLEWLDFLITVSLNPANSKIDAILPEHLIKLKQQIIEEKIKVENFLRNKVFSLLDEKKIQLLITQYHSGLIILLDQALENHIKCPAKNTNLKQLTNEIITCLDQLLSYIELRFSKYLSLNERVPSTYLTVTKKELKQKLDKLKTGLLRQIQDSTVGDIVLHVLYTFISPTKDEHSFVFQEIFYVKELCIQLEQLEDTINIGGSYSSLDQLLIYMNFNSKRYMDNFTQRLAEKINTCENISDKMEKLLFYFKEFKQVQRKPGAMFDPKYRDLHIEIGNWFTQEIFYLEKKLHYEIVPIQGISEKKATKDQGEQKVLCILSVDQMALLLRSVDDLKIVMARSLNAVFKSIVPFLSTPYQENISYDSMRSKSYSAETRDKEIVIQTLEKMIKKIKEY